MYPKKNIFFSSPYESNFYQIFPRMPKPSFGEKPPANASYG